MCGIAGQYCYQSGVPDADLLTQMSSRLTHRGPDGEGAHISGNVGLVHRRLAIIDLSSDALQPMSNEDGSLWLVFNGEIYNFIEIREELLQKGHRFHSHSDSEVILHAYEEWGAGCLTHFNGMWAFAIWDEKKQELFCSRDRFGIKPFYYTEVNGSFLFASEIKALLSHPYAGTGTLMMRRCRHVPLHGVSLIILKKRCSRASISSCLPMHCLSPKMEFSHLPGIGICRSMQRSNQRRVIPLRQIVFDLYSKLQRGFICAAMSRSGPCLSGGIDSSTLTVIINNLIREEAPQSVGARQKTFSAVFSDTRFDESRYIDEVVSSTDVDAGRTEPSAEQLLSDIDRLLYMQDEPFGSLSIYAQVRVMRIAQKRVKVVLDGQGADELLAGYLGTREVTCGDLSGHSICGPPCTNLWEAYPVTMGFSANPCTNCSSGNSAGICCDAPPRQLTGTRADWMKCCNVNLLQQTCLRSSIMKIAIPWRFPSSPGSLISMSGWQNILHRSLFPKKSETA